MAFFWMSNRGAIAFLKVCFYNIFKTKIAFFEIFASVNHSCYFFTWTIPFYDSNEKIIFRFWGLLTKIWSFLVLKYVYFLHYGYQWKTLYVDFMHSMTSYATWIMLMWCKLLTKTEKSYFHYKSTNILSFSLFRVKYDIREGVILVHKYWN